MPPNADGIQSTPHSPAMSQPHSIYSRHPAPSPSLFSSRSVIIKSGLTVTSTVPSIPACIPAASGGNHSLAIELICTQTGRPPSTPSSGRHHLHPASVAAFNDNYQLPSASPRSAAASQSRPPFGVQRAAWGILVLLNHPAVWETQTAATSPPHVPGVKHIIHGH